MDRTDEDRADPGPVREYIGRLCRLQAHVAENVLGYDEPYDCICGEGGFWYLDNTWPEPNIHWRNSGVAIAYIEQAVAEKVERERHLKPEQAKAFDRLMGDGA